MQSNIQTSNMLNRRRHLSYSVQGSRVRTYLKLIKMRRALKVAKAVYGLRSPVLLANVSPIMSYSKTVVNSLKEVSNTSYKTYPVSGIMLNGAVFELATLAFRIKDAGCTLLPTPIASDYDKAFSDRSKLLSYLENGHQRRLIYECQLSGLKRSEILSLYRDMMSFTISEERLKPTGTQLCLL